MTEKHASLCLVCLWKETTIEIRGGTTLEYPSCDFGHAHFKRVQEPKQCRDYNPVAAVEND